MSAPSPHIVRLATRGSPLAMWQARRVAELIKANFPTLTVDLVPLTTQPDRRPNTPLAAMGGDKGLFVREIEQALLDGRADAAVHSLKDMPVEESTAGLQLVAFPERANPADVIISKQNLTLHELPQGATVATSSLRRRAQLLRQRPDLQTTDIRGNIQTRLDKLHTADFQALVMAAAGLERLDLQSQVSACLPITDFLPAPGQGILAVQAPENSPFAAIWQAMDQPVVRLQAECERLFSQAIGATCRSAAGCYMAVDDHGTAEFSGVVLSSDGRVRLHGQRHTTIAHARETVLAVAHELIAAGCRSLL